MQSGPLVAIECTDGFAFLDDGAGINCSLRRARSVEDGVFGGELGHFVLDVAAVEAGGPAKVFGLENAGRQAYIHTLVAHSSDVVPIVGITRKRLSGLCEEQCLGFGIVSIERQIDAISKQAQVETEVKLIGLLPGNVRVGQSRRCIGHTIGQTSIACAQNIIGRVEHL